MSESPRTAESRGKAGRSSLCLCMIVRDEAELIERCLVSARDHIAYWLICDTGSSDGTQEIVRRAMAGVPGELRGHEWVDFGANRTRAIQLARGKADYILVIDADTTLEVDDGALDRLGADAYDVRHVEEVSFGYRTCLVRGDREWCYIGRVHEQLDTAGASVGVLEGVRVRVWSIGGVRNARYEDELKVLEQEHAGSMRRGVKPASKDSGLLLEGLR